MRRAAWFALGVWLMGAGSSPCPAGTADWLMFESGGFRIFKRYGLMNGERLTMTLFPAVTYRPGYRLRRFYELIDEDLPRIGVVVNHFQTELTEIPGLAVFTTLRRCRDHTGAVILVYYQGFFRPGMNRMWFVRTDLNDNLDLLVAHYGEELEMILAGIGYVSHPGN